MRNQRRSGEWCGLVSCLTSYRGVHMHEWLSSAEWMAGSPHCGSSCFPDVLPVRHRRPWQTSLHFHGKRLLGRSKVWTPFYPLVLSFVEGFADQGLTTSLPIHKQSFRLGSWGSSRSFMDRSSTNTKHGLSLPKLVQTMRFGPT